MEMMQLKVDAFINNEVNKKKNIIDIFNRYISRVSKDLTLDQIKGKQNGPEVKEKVNLRVVKSKEELKSDVQNFINVEIDDLQENGSLCLDMCEEEGSYHMVSYWIDGTYSNIQEYLNKNYTEELGDIILEMYPKDLTILESKVKKAYGECTTKQIVYEALASILLNEMQYFPEWYTVYGTEEEDMIDFNKYHVMNAIRDKDEFPVMQSEDIVAAMYGVNSTVQPSDMYNIFGYYADDLKIEEPKTLLDEKEEDFTFTPDPFLILGVEARWKNMIDLINGTKGNRCCIDYVLKFNEILQIEDEDTRNIAIMLSAVDDYMNRFSCPPKSVPLIKDMVQASYKGDYFEIQYKIRGIKNKKMCWDDIYTKGYDIPLTHEEYQNLIFLISTDFKRELIGMQKKADSDDLAYYGKYPNKDSASHGLKFVKDINVRKKDKRGMPEKKTARPNYNLALAEKQSTYFIKKSLRYARRNPILSTSFGIDSTITQHLIRKVAKHSYYLVHNDSLVEYSELVKYRNRMIKEWGVENRITVTKPIKTYWKLQEENGWNFQRKGDRRTGASASELCCNSIKHRPMYNFIDSLIEKDNPMEMNYSGLRAFESRAREQQVKRDGIVYYAKSWKSLRVNPIAFFTDEMVWEYVDKYKVTYCEVYDKVLYYEDVFDNVSEEEYGKVIYKPRVGCWCCCVTSTSSYYLFWLRKYMPKQYEFLMIKKGMARDIFIMGAKKHGIIADFNIVKDKKKEVNPQISMFDTIEDTEEVSSYNISSEEILRNYPLEAMENMITRRPCKFIG